MSLTPPGWPSCWNTVCCARASCPQPRSVSSATSPATARASSQDHSSECQRVQKTLEDAGIKLDSVASVLGVSGRLMLKALVAGERDPEVLAEMAKRRLRSKIPKLREAMHGRFSEHHALLIGVSLDHLEHLEAAIARLDTRVDELIGPFVEARDRLDTITGVGKQAAESIIAEIGVDMRVFPTAAHLCSWAGLCPANNITGGRATLEQDQPGQPMAERSSTSAPGRRLTAATPTWRPSFWRLARRIGKKKAAVAVSHSILAICWHLLSDNCDYDDRRRLLRHPRHPPNPPTSRGPAPSPRLQGHPRPTAV